MGQQLGSVGKMIDPCTAIATLGWPEVFWDATEPMMIAEECGLSG